MYKVKITFDQHNFMLILAAFYQNTNCFSSSLVLPQTECLQSGKILFSKIRHFNNWQIPEFRPFKAIKIIFTLQLIKQNNQITPVRRTGNIVITSVAIAVNEKSLSSRKAR